MLERVAVCTKLARTVRAHRLDDSRRIPSQNLEIAGNEAGDLSTADLSVNLHRKSQSNQKLC